MVLVQKWPFFNFFFLGNIHQENDIYNSLERKNSFLGYKIRSLQSRKIDNFLNGLTHCFGPKMAIFPTFFFGNIDQENVFYDILKRKNAFLGYKKQEVQKVEKLTFLQRC